MAVPGTDVFFYKDSDGYVPVQAWLAQLQRRNRRAFARCYQRIQRLVECGHELRRPEADFLRDGIYELRIREGNVQYRILYFFHGKSVAFWRTRSPRTRFHPRPSSWPSIAS